MASSRPSCVLDDCESPHHGRGYCRKHYKRFMSTGDPMGTKQRPRGMSLAEVIDYFAIKGEIEGDCWGWRSAVDSDGYPMFHWQGANRKVLRYAYSLAWGEIPRNLVVRHKCNNTECLNPQHLMSGTCADNVNDAVEVGHIGSSRRLTEKEREAICRMYNLGTSKARLARDFNVSRATIRYTLDRGYQCLH